MGADDVGVAFEDVVIAAPEPLQQPGGALDVAEEEGQLTGRQLTSLCNHGLLPRRPAAYGVEVAGAASTFQDHAPTLGTTRLPGGKT